MGNTRVVSLWQPPLTGTFLHLSYGTEELHESFPNQNKNRHKSESLLFTSHTLQLKIVMRNTNITQKPYASDFAHRIGSVVLQVTT